MGAVTLAGSAVSLLALPFVELPSQGALGLLATSIVLHTAYHFMLPKAYDFGDLGQMYPLMRGTAPILVAVGGFTIVGEHLEPLQAAGLLCLTAGIATLVLDRKDGVFKNPRAILWSLATGALIAAYTVIDALGARSSGSPMGFAVLLTIGDGFLTFAILMAFRSSKFMSTLKTSAWRSGAAGLMQVGAYWIAVWALAQAPMGMVSAIRETSVVFGALLSAFVLGEGLSAWRFLSVTLVVAGIALSRKKGV